jgi:hypothetical protein
MSFVQKTVYRKIVSEENYMIPANSAILLIVNCESVNFNLLVKEKPDFTCPVLNEIDNRTICWKTGQSGQKPDIWQP